MRKVFIDTDVLLDTILDRKPHAEFSHALIGLCEQKVIDGYTSLLVLANLYYIIKKMSHHHRAVLAINKIRSLLQILPCTDRDLDASINAGFDDIEDGIQHFAALHHKIDCLITRNTKDFRKATISILTPEEFLQSIRL
jgi:predicted nucleic acid-binding protein